MNHTRSIFNTRPHRALILGTIATCLIVLSPVRAHANETNGIRENYIRSLKMMTSQLSASAMYQMQVIGSFFDAKEHLEVNRDNQVLSAQAHKDYYPSEQMCRFGTFIRSVAQSEHKSHYEQQAMNAHMMRTYLNASAGNDTPARLKQFRTTYCDPADNNSGLSAMCIHDESDNNSPVGAETPQRVNKDIDYARSLAAPLTLALDFEDDTANDEEQDILALARNLYWPTALVGQEGATLDQPHKYFDYRNAIAMNSVAHNSFTNIAGLKAAAAGDEENADTQSGWAFMKILMRDFGLKDEEIETMLGERPSYYAQMEVLTKKIYQSPDFYTNLYDKPTNVHRTNAAMEAIKLMQGRDHLDSALRQEMLTSLRLETAIKKHNRELNRKINAYISQ